MMGMERRGTGSGWSPPPRGCAAATAGEAARADQVSLMSASDLIGRVPCGNYRQRETPRYTNWRKQEEKISGSGHIVSCRLNNASFSYSLMTCDNVFQKNTRPVIPGYLGILMMALHILSIT